MKRIRGGMGLGDALYVQAITRHLVNQGERLEVCTKWSEVFRYLPVRIAPFSRSDIQYLAHYSQRKGQPSKQFDDCRISCGIREPVELKIDWQTTNPALVSSLQVGKPIVCVQLPRNPMGRTDGFGAELLPDCRAIQHAIDAIKGRATVVQIGAGAALHRFTGIDVDLSNKTSVSELLDVASIASAFIGYCSFVVPLAESFNRPLLAVWSRRGTKASSLFVRQITPQKILYKPTSSHVFDDATPDAIREAADALC